MTNFKPGMTNFKVGITLVLRVFHFRMFEPTKELKIAPTTVAWWYWMLTLLAMVAGFAGRIEGFYAALAISAVQCVHFMFKDGFAALPTQVRLVYGALIVLALVDPSRLLFGLMLLGTIMVTFFDRCIIARVLLMMPWNHRPGVGSTTP